MREDFIHFLWRQARFNLRDLQTTTGAPLSIQHFGTHNHDAGPDFSAGQVRIDGVQWAGHIEMHVNASQWYEHGHDSDPAYDNVILHVVFEEDRPVYRRNGQRIPCLELHGRIPPNLYKSYWRLQHNEYWVPCQHQLHLVSDPVKTQWLGTLLNERLAEKSQRITERLAANGRDWEDTFYQSLARSLGGRVNADAMEMLARSLPLRILLKHKHSLIQLEALFFGQSGLLPEPGEEEDAYVTLLRREYQLLRTKHSLRPVPATAWRYLRLRPNNFPTIRIAQLATMVFRTGQLFGKTLAAANAKELSNMYEVELSNYWRTHYRFGKTGKAGKRRLGVDMINSILLNTVAPALVSYSHHRLDERYLERAVGLLEQLPAENNKIIRKWKQLGFEAKNAGESQALLHLKKQYCEPTRCTDCAIGCTLLTKTFDNLDAQPLLTLNEEAVVYGVLADERA
ncbi:DUF2851 family protein [Lewinella sp. 4G2]|uniref:DUF2851 family protein n=1 Tax=Lewinella sp. 4G2 TaxID=1803372 RepID=UPI0007B474A2|nr:DUF2851 family protein [Lewinella sp. 4G2]OAV45751.1 hypothetical protein A3850_001320 [Lewinella sp. 4G2]